MGEASTVASNTADGAAGGRKSEQASEALKGISKSFETRALNLDLECVEKGINGAFSKYFIDHKDKVVKLEDNGVTISRNIISAAERVSMTDGDVEDGYRSSTQFMNPKLSPYLNPALVDDPSQLPVGVMSPDYHRSPDANLLRRGVND